MKSGRPRGKHPAKPSHQKRNVRRIAADILSRVETGGGYSSILLDHAAETLKRREDRALLRELVGGTLRLRGRLDFLLGRYSHRPLADIHPALRQFLRVGLYQLVALDRIPEWAAVNETVAAARGRCGDRAGAYANAVLRAAVRDRGSYPVPRRDPDRPERYIAYRHSMPRWLCLRWIAAFGPDSAESLAESSSQAPEVNFRFSRVKALPPSGERGLLESLRENGVVCSPVPGFPGAYRVEDGVLSEHPAFRQGHLVIQDPASQAVPLLCGLQSGGRALDVCSAPGGKTALLSEIAGPSGRVVAADLHLNRMRLVVRSCARLGAGNVLNLVGDFSAASPPLSGSFDTVLVDAPCSGTGTLRRHPEIRWKLGQADLIDFAERQLSILRCAAPLVKTGGSLVYAVCSLESEEGPDVVERFCRESGFTVVSPHDFLPEPLHSMVAGDGSFRTMPHRDGCDGFFAVRMINTGSS